MAPMSYLNSLAVIRNKKETVQETFLGELNQILNVLKVLKLLSNVICSMVRIFSNCSKALKIVINLLKIDKITEI